MAKPKCDAFGFPPPSTTLSPDDPLLIPTIEKQGREAFREQEIARLVALGDAVPPDAPPVLLLMGGGSAVGKSTILASLQEGGSIPRKGVVSVNADDFKEIIPEFKELVKRGDARAAEVVHVESNVMAQETLSRALAKRTNIIYDGTLSLAQKVKDLIRQARRHGYGIRIIGVTARPQTAIERSLKRGQAGGRYVPVSAVLFTHKGFSQHFEAYAALADSAELWKTDCTLLGEKEDGQLIAEKRNGKLYILHDAGYAEFRKSALLNENASNPTEIFPKDGK